MPTYEYECRACGRRFESRQSIKDDPLAKCPSCQGDVQRVVTGGSGFIIKGGTGRTGGRGDACSLEQTGRTCCGRSTRCDQPACESE
jgi:putative FmdB family regulatory protein